MIGVKAIIENIKIVNQKKGHSEQTNKQNQSKSETRRATRETHQR